MSAQRTSSAHASGKIILCGEYAVAFGGRGIAFPSKQGITVTFEPDPAASIGIIWSGIEDHPKRNAYVMRIVEELEKLTCEIFRGTLTIEGDLPMGKGMGSSTALVISIVRSLLPVPESRGFPLQDIARKIEDAVNPGNSGLDFAVISMQSPILFEKGFPPHEIDLPPVLQNAVLIDTGMPDEPTSVLLAQIRQRQDQLKEPLEIISRSAERVLGGGDLFEIIHAHHRAQVKLGVVTVEAQSLITKIEQEGGAAKVIGAGGITGGSGIVMALHEDLSVIRKSADRHSMPVL